MDNLRERALKALGWKETPKGYWEDENHQLVATAHTIPSDAELIGLLLLELDRLMLDYDTYRRGNVLNVLGDSENRVRIFITGKPRLEALVLAVEAARERKEASNVRPE